jgi:hypothetical protein
MNASPDNGKPKMMIHFIVFGYFGKLYYLKGEMNHPIKSCFQF